tara:strand:- start:25 stop:204 length:180 start_codon:yes stop_codon:yes gene_type:complete
MLDVTVLSGAGDDLLTQYVWLENRQDGLGNKMDTDFLEAMNLLRLNPHLGAFFDAPIRK